MEISNQVRWFAFIARVLKGQEDDPLCSKCKAFSNSLAAVRRDLEDFRGALPEGALSSDLEGLLAGAESVLGRLTSDENTVGQKKAGNCKMPEGVCFVKLSKGIIEKVR